MTTFPGPRRRTWTRAVGTRLKSLLRYLKYLIVAAPLMYPRRVHCNACGWRGKRFVGNGWHAEVTCPRCRSDVRHRLLLAALGPGGPFSLEELVGQRRVLHFAPEAVVQRSLQQRAETYLTADYLNPRRDLQLDISEMSAIGDGQFDLVIACDVLEHVQHDRRALREIYRVLRPGGCAILTVPQQDGLIETYEDPLIVSEAARERAFGQRDHLRIYGSDFLIRIQDAQFEVTAVSAQDFPDEQVRHQVLVPPVRSEHPLATNNRQVYFAAKQVDAA